MMNNMFSMFDSNVLNMPLNLLTTMTMMQLKIYQNMKWKKNNMMKMYKNTLMKKMLVNINNKTLTELFTPMITMVVIMNMMNLIPNIMASTSMVMLNFSMTMSLWTTVLMMGMMNPKTIMMNLSPKNTPMMMMWIINLIELNSMIFQILSLTMRLSINMMLGHIIMTLMNKIHLMMMYMMIETMVIMIQSYIFITLNMLNFNNLN